MVLVCQTKFGMQNNFPFCQGEQVKTLLITLKRVE